MQKTEKIRPPKERPADQNGDVFGAKLNDACSGLTYISETDAPVEPFIAEEGSLAELIAAIKEKSSGPLEQRTLREFFANPTRERNWHDKRRRESVRRFTELKDLLEENLKNTACIRAGRIQIDIFVVGTDSDGRLAGIRTYAVET